MIALMAAAAMAAGSPDVAQPSAGECQILRAAIGAELASEKHFAETLRLTAVPNEWLLDDAEYAPDSARQLSKVDPPPATGFPAASLSVCGVTDVFSGVRKVRRNGARNLALASKEPLLSSKADAFKQHLGSVMIGRATIDELRGRATVIFGGYCGDVDAVTLTKDASGAWVSSQPQRLWFTLCETFVTEVKAGSVP